MTTRTLFLLVLLGLAGIPGTAQDTMNIPGEGACGLEGSAHDAPHKKLNRLKNRHKPPKAQDFDSRVSLVAMLAPGNDKDRWNEQRAATLTGFVVAAQVGGVETCNCKTKKKKYRDTHIALATSEDATADHKLVHVEVTPRLRQQMANQGIDWSTGHLGQTLPGKWVTIKGWMLFDFIHEKDAENTDPGDPQNWRATAWEIHPITSIEILPGPPVFSPNGIRIAAPSAEMRARVPRRRWVHRRDHERSEYWVTRRGERYTGQNPYRVPSEPEEE